MPQSRKVRSRESRQFLAKPWFTAALFTAVYFADVCLRASGKFFWYDELFTVYFARLPTLGALWTALNSGIDFNPPPFYLLTAFVYRNFGGGNLSMRMPEIVGFWVFCLCLFRFVSRRAGVPAGAIAMLFPVVTQAYFYAYEARPHALVLGFAGLALVSWQWAEGAHRFRRLALAAFSICLLGALSMHCYALVLVIPFAVIELFATFGEGNFDRLKWLALALPVMAVLPLYAILLSSYRTLTTRTTFGAVSPAGWTQIGHYFYFLLQPCVTVLLLLLLLFALHPLFAMPATREAELPGVLARACRKDVALGLVFVALPVFGVVLGKVVHGPFFYRYFLVTVAGVSICLGMGAALSSGQRRLAGLVVAVLAAAIVFQLGTLIRERAQGGGEWLIEPSSKEVLNTTPGKPLARDPLLVSERSSLPIGVLNPLEFVYLAHYAPALRARLYFLAPSASDFTFVGFQRVLECCSVQFNAPAVYDQFARAHAAYLVYGNPDNFNQIALFGQLGARVESVTVEGGHFLARLGRG